MTLVVMAACYSPPPSGDEDDPNVPYTIAACDNLYSTATATNENVPLGEIQKLAWLDNWLIGFSGAPEHFVAARGFVRVSLDELRYGGVDPKKITDEIILDKLANGYIKYRRKCIEKLCQENATI